MTEEQRVSIRGTSDGLIIELGAGDLDSVLSELDQRIGKSASFFRGGRVALRVGPRVLNRDEIEAVGNRLYEWGVTLWAVESDMAETRAAADSLGLEVEAAGIAPLPAVRERATETPETVETVDESDARSSGRLASEGLLIRRTLRSGAAVIHRGHVVVVGDVNSGAEIVAGGDVVVWGKLRGLVHAGAGGDEDSIVCALAMAPSQLRIGSKVIVTPREGGSRHMQPQTALVRDGHIGFEIWLDSAPPGRTRRTAGDGRFRHWIRSLFRKK